VEVNEPLLTRQRNCDDYHVLLEIGEKYPFAITAAHILFQKQCPNELIVDITASVILILQSDS